MGRFDGAQVVPDPAADRTEGHGLRVGATGGGVVRGEAAEKAR
jgi:hypothetical protein